MGTVSLSMLIRISPRGLIGRDIQNPGVSTLVILHDQEGRPLLVTTDRGDQHLTIGLPAILTRYE